MNKSKTATEVCKALQTVFARFRIPERVVSDNGPPFNSAEYVFFASEWGFEIENSSPKYPQSNGEAERAVQTIKKLIKKEKDRNKKEDASKLKQKQYFERRHLAKQLQPF
ncbi:sec1 family domain-containing 2 [Paramuricea clavata]|uniref:Sec1 family domain-containing 2 n=1 Tax=Paramuricea clavata TaxID=317549 RepID=A0A7D9E5I9_PARCT|nr:sec1 family domain-containing 2 [Paramuricea clavata]